MSHLATCRAGCHQNPTRQELERNHGTPETFAEAVWRACDDLFLTTDEAIAGIKTYRLEWAEAGNEAPSTNSDASETQDLRK